MAFQGVQRRLTTIGKGAGLSVLDDYAHQPTEIRAVLGALRAHHKGRVVAICQPHRYNRLGEMMDGFSQSFQDADSVIILPVYRAGETPIQGVSSEILYEKTLQHHQSVFSFQRWQDHMSSLCHLLKSIIKPGDMVVCRGAGDVTQLTQVLPVALEADAIASYA